MWTIMALLIFNMLLNSSYIILHLLFLIHCLERPFSIFSQPSLLKIAALLFYAKTENYSELNEVEIMSHLILMVLRLVLPC